MSDVVIPKEKQTAYQRWEMASFEEESRARGKAVPQPAIHSAQEGEEEKNARLQAELEQARREGYKIGLQQGFDAGIADAAAQVQQDREQFQAVLASLNEAVRTADEAISEQLLALALDIAKAMVKDRLNVDPAIILPVVQESIHYLPVAQKPARLIVNPEDAPIVKKYLQEDMADTNWQVHEDASVERGGCMVETGDNQIDASNVTRWKRICDALSQHGNWIDPE
mgnify:CR=1 FL=1